MKTKLIIKRIVISAICLIAISIVGAALYMMVWVSGVTQYPCFSNVNGLGRLFISYESLIANRGEPNERELIVRDGWGDRYALYYDGVTFVIVNNMAVSFDITSKEYRLDGRGGNRIGVGSTREKVKASFERRRRNASTWGEFPQNIYREIEEQHLSLPNASYGWVSSRSGWIFVEFEFDENDIVVKMRMGPWY